MKSSENRVHEIILESLDVLSHIFWGPEPNQCRMLLKGELTSVFETFDQKLDKSVHVKLNKLNSIIKKFDDPEVLFLSLNEEYVRLFISHKDGIIAPLYESCYEYDNAPLMGPPALRMHDFLDSVGLTLLDEFNEPPDHICIELEYLYFVLEKAWGGKKNKVQLKEACDFVSKIMLPWVDTFHKKLASEYPKSFYTLSAFLLCKVLRSIK